MDKYILSALDAMKWKLPEDCSVEHQQVRKNNGVILDGFIIREAGKNIAPTFYLYDKDREQYTPEEFASHVVGQFEREKNRGIEFEVGDFMNADWVRSRLMFDIVNRGRNEGANWASIPITDELMIAFKVSVMPNASIRVTNDHLKLWGMTPDEMLEVAKKNAVVMDKATFKTITEVLIDTMFENFKGEYPDISDAEFKERIKEEMFPDGSLQLYVLSTQMQSNAALLYPDMLESIREELNDNLVILPSSTHELLIMKETDAKCMGLDAVKAMVQEVNRDVVMQDDASDFLSDELLIYDGELRQISVGYPNRDEYSY